MSALDDVQLAAVLEEVRGDFLAALPGIVTELRAATAAALTGSTAAAAAGRSLCHQLAGTAGSFGLGDLGTRARVLEAVLAAPDPRESWRMAVATALGAFLDDLPSAAPASPGPSPPRSSPRATAEPPAHRGPVRSGPGACRDPARDGPIGASRSLHPAVALSVGDPVRRAALDAAAKQFGFVVVDDPALAPAVWVADLDAVAGISAQWPGASVVGLLPDQGLASRVAAVRAGCRAAIAPDADPVELASALDRVVPSEVDVPRVLVVDDDPHFGAAAAKILEASGLSVSLLQDATALLDRTSEVRPDLVLLDMHLPGYSGLELAAVLRHDDRMVGIPIVFLTADLEPSRALEALEVGADDFLVKPLDPERLVSVVSSRLERSRVVRSFMDRDGLTGLLNHARTLDRLEAEVALARRRREPLSLAIVDVDHFKRVNDVHGHAAGDRVLRSLATLLRRRARRGDVVGRCGGEEFVLLLPGARGAAAERVVDERRRAFGELGHVTAAAPLTVTFSAGVAELGDGETANALWERADAALYAAKRAGRNRVVGARPVGNDGLVLTPG